MGPVLRKILRDFSEYESLVIPQVYSYSEFHRAAAMGYRNVILTIYRLKTSPFELIRFAKEHSPFAITMPWKVVYSGIATSLRNNNL